LFATIHTQRQCQYHGILTLKYTTGLLQAKVALLVATEGEK